ncbi:uncharacterized protein LOC119439943 [Dermacentor silvarum]|uniref:uncharacterized protein LOC119439943 n=1 Tax=Dermacentor silvarum TaxID=543639 RepID=UPI001897A267|nr:uncharacterized protein LOC119439943 [Dermacentor silvarum]
MGQGGAGQARQGRDSRPQDVSSVQLSLPTLWLQNPQVWFHQIEAQFCLYTSETTLYYHVVSVLPPDVAGELSDVLSSPTGATPYQHLKTKVLERYMPSECTRLRQLLTQEDLGDQRPSQLLRRMRQLLGECDVPTHSALLRELFLQRLSQPIRLVLAAAGDVTLDRLAELADQPPSGEPFASSWSSHSFAHTSSSESQPSTSLLVPPAFPTPSHEVHTSLFVAGQRPPGLLTAACGLAFHPCRLFMVTDKFCGTRFLIDTVAEISVVPQNKVDLSRAPGQSLGAANASSIATYGLQSLTLDFVLRGTFRWVFVIADVVHPIIGSDFLSYFALDVNVRRRRLTDGLTRLSIFGVLSDLAPMGITTLIPSSPFEKILEDFPEFTKQCNLTQPPKHTKTHHIVTRGPPLAARPRRLFGNCLPIAKREFNHMLQLGIIRPSSIAWASPLHLVPKGDPGDCRPCRDCRALNTKTVHDSYSLPQFQDFTSRLDGCTIFSKVDLVKAYHQFPIEPADIPKTAITMPFGRRFDPVHLDIVGHLPVSQGYRYILTMVDLFPRWPEAVPIHDINAKTNGREETVNLDLLKPAYVETATESLASPPDLVLECHSRPSVRFHFPV